MNILFKDEDLFIKLRSHSIYSAIVGSRMYGMFDKLSDIDHLYILPTPNYVLNDLFKTHHQLQYKEKGQDHVFVFLDTFLKNIFNGDSTINFEVFQEIVEGSHLDWLRSYRKDLYTYTIIKSYLGFAKRDIKYFPYDKDLRAKRRKLKHIYRGYLSAKLILEGTFDVKKLKEDKKFVEIDKLESDIDFRVELTKMTKLLTKQREVSNQALDKKELNYFLPEETQLNFNKDYHNFLNSDQLKSFEKLGGSQMTKEDWDRVMRMYYDVNKNGLNY
jgi:hypothetical protein